MRIRLELVLTDIGGALIRALGLIERRGHRIESCHAECVEDIPGRQRVQVTVNTHERSPEVLARQLLRLYDVLAVDLFALSEISIEQVPRVVAVSPSRSLGIGDVKTANSGEVRTANG